MFDVKLILNDAPFVIRQGRLANGYVGPLDVDAGCAVFDSDGYIWSFVLNGREYPLYYSDQRRGRAVRVFTDYLLPAGATAGTLYALKNSSASRSPSREPSFRDVKRAVTPIVTRIQSLISKHEIHNISGFYGDSQGNPFLLEGPFQLQLTSDQKNQFKWYDF